MRLLTLIVLLVVVGSVGVGPAWSDGAVHLGDASHVGVGLQLVRTQGTIFGSTVGAGTLDSTDTVFPTLEASAGLGSVSLDLQLAHIQIDSLARGAFSFDRVFFPLGGDVTASLTWLDIVGRYRLLDRQSLRLSLLGGARLLRSEIEVNTSTIGAKSGDFQALPVAGAVMEARVYPRSVLFGQVRYFDVTSEEESSYTVSGEAGLSYLLGTEDDEAAGWRLTGGYRFMELEAQERITQSNRVALTLEMQGPYLHLSWVY